MSQFVLMYHPQLGNARASVSVASVDDHAAVGWLLVDGVTPAPTAKYLTPALGDARYAKIGEAGSGLDDAGIAALVADDATDTGTALKAASVAAVETEATVAPTGAWDFTQAPTVAGVPIGTDGGAAVSDASTTTKGIVELATNTETTTGTDTSRAVTPAGVKAVVDGLAIPAAYTDAAAVGAVEAATSLSLGTVDFRAAPTVNGVPFGSTPTGALTFDDYTYLRGVNTAGGGGSPEDATRVPGTVETDYHFNSQAFYDYIASRGHTIVRIDFLWERVQPVMGGALDATKLAELKDAVQRAANSGLLVLLDMKNYGRRWLADDTQVVMGAGITPAQFADVWSRLATEFANQPAAAAYGLMNEPHDLPGTDTWKTHSQAAVTAIRDTGDTRPIFVAGDAWSGVWGWQQNNGDPWITDPANNIVYEAHMYLDSDRSGTYENGKTYAGENQKDIDAGWSGGITQRVTADANNFITWLSTHNQRGFIGEMGWPNDESTAEWNALGQLALDLLNAAGIGVTFWGTGEWMSGDVPPNSYYNQDLYHRGEQDPQSQTLIVEAEGNQSVLDPSASTGYSDADAVAAVQNAATLNLGDVDFASAPTVNGQPISSGGTVAAALPNWAAKLGTAPETAKVAFLGDSTSDPGFQEIGQLKTQLVNVHAATSGALAGVVAANVEMFGIAGHTSEGYWAEATVGGPVTTFSPDLIVYSMGINDVRFGATTSTLVSRMITEIDAIRADLPNVDLILRIPNSICTDGGDGSITSAQAQQYSNTMRNAYLQLTNRWERCAVWNSQDKVFGRRSRTFTATEGLMYDQIHPSGAGMEWVADSLVEGYLATATTTSTAPPVEPEPEPEPTGPTIYAEDDFTRANSASLGSAPTGGAWTTKGDWGIDANAAEYLGTGSATGQFRHATVEAGVADCAVEATVTLGAGESGICFRMTDAENYLLLRYGGNAANNYELFRIENGGGSQLASIAATTPGLPATLRVELSGSTITPYVNGTAQTPVTSTFNQTATRHGLWAAGNGTGNAYDDFAVTALA
ncbi:cellulase family glycosylhydrolase [Modestobacter sp. VKM Ac-2985]|uniref:cellulase family glycosylhydrolase n=1 Tax=Modestobacter sp. VKM Ac-2985 TaxID=3004139 RepID=UPI0022AB7C71|nr:cellulase family glycosylhydrolase [Modestobacter sp. VKM Ac-2985]MCZ2837125.1 cellulase family glycosylhydrolase [Modestobacter sp. VKM Ac-2985]